MAIVTNEFTSFDAIGNREDLRPIIFNISSMELPFMGLCGRTTADATRTEWQTDALAAAANNNQLEGDTFTYSAITATTRLANSTTIARKTMSVSKTQDAVKKAGRAKEYAYQLVNRSKEIKRDIEFTLTNNQTPVPVSGASTTVSRQLRPLPGWYSTNTDRGAGGSAGTSTAAVTDGAQREFDQTMLENTLRNITNQGGNVDTIMVGLYNKQAMRSEE